MGCLHSLVRDENFRTSRKIDCELRNSNLQKSTVIRLLLLGAGESGKSTFLKQMKILHSPGYSLEELAQYKTVVHNNTVQSILAILTAMPKLEIKFSDSNTAACAMSLLKTVEGNPDVTLTPELGAIIKQLWVDPDVQRCLQQAGRFQLNDSACHFLDCVERTCQADYIPTNEDVLRTRVKTTGIAEFHFEANSHRFTLIDVGGQRSERKKWIHCFDGVNAILFLAAISDYDMNLREDENANRVQESLMLFKSICNNAFFTKTTIILFLNKRDLLEKKLQITPFKHCFPEYTGSDTYKEVCDYVKDMFEKEAAPNNPVFTHFTCATDSSNVQLVFEDIVSNVLMNNLKCTGLS